MMANNQDGTWWLIFGKTNFSHPIFNWVHPDFQHVMAVKKSPGNQFWVTYNPRFSHIDIDVLPIEMAPNVVDCASDHTEVLRVVVEKNDLESMHHPNILSCVDCVKAVLGIRDFWCWTPYQLYNRLMGGKYVQCIEARREGGPQGSQKAETATGATA